MQWWIFLIYCSLWIALCSPGAPEGVEMPATAPAAPLEVVAPGPQYRIIAPIPLEAVLRPEEYVLGPGDVLAINISSRIPQNYPGIQVSLDGKIFIPPLGEVRADGLTIKQLQDKLQSDLNKYLKDFQVSVSLVEPRKIKVHVYGQVKKPGVYEVTPFTRVTEVIEQSEIIKESGSQRNVKIYRKGKEFASLDLEEILRGGEVSNNIRLEAGDVIKVPLIGTTIDVSGEVRVPGRYEVKDGEGLEEVIAQAGGLTGQAALAEATLERVRWDGKKELISVNLNEKAQDLKLRPGDSLNIPPLRIIQNTIKVFGEVSKPGIYILRAGEKLRDVIINLGGLTPNADLRKARIERTSPEGQKKVISVDLYKLMVENDLSENLELKNGDVLFIPKIKDRIYVLGEVDRPGAFEFKENRRLSEYVGEAGGPTRRANLGATTIFRGEGTENLKRLKVDLGKVMGGRTDLDLILQPGDVVWVPEAPVVGWQDWVGILYGLRNLLPRFFWWAE